jgi:hypothetical protein
MSQKILGGFQNIVRFSIAYKLLRKAHYLDAKLGRNRFNGVSCIKDKVSKKKTKKESKEKRRGKKERNTLLYTCETRLLILPVPRTQLHLVMIYSIVLIVFETTRLY